MPTAETLAYEPDGVQALEAAKSKGTAQPDEVRTASGRVVLIEQALIRLEHIRIRKEKSVEDRSIARAKSIAEGTHARNQTIYASMSRR